MSAARGFRLPLSLCFGVVVDATGRALGDGDVAELNRAAESYRHERPKTRRALREAIDEIEAGMGGPKDMDEDEVALLLRLHAALGPAELAKWEREWNRRCGR